MLEGTVSIGITFSEYAQDGDKLTAYVDSDHAHFRNLLESIDEKQKQATVVFEDNSGAVSLSRVEGNSGDLWRRKCFHCLKYIAASDYFDLIILILILIREQVLVDDIISRGHSYCFERTLRETSSCLMHQN